jgi:hypothetical protein
MDNFTEASEIARGLSIELGSLIVSERKHNDSGKEQWTPDHCHSDESDADTHGIDNRASKVVGQAGIDSLEILAEPVQEPTSAHGIVETNLREQNGLQEF